METPEHLAAELKRIKARRKQGDLDEAGFYVQLLRLSDHLIPLLIQEAEGQGTPMQLADIKRQIPLILAFLEDQIARFRTREAQR